MKSAATVKRSHHVKGFQLAPKGSPVPAAGLRQLLQLVYKKRLQKIKIRAVGELPLFISVLPEPESGFYKVAEIKTHFANLKLCDINKSNWRRPE